MEEKAGVPVKILRGPNDTFGVALIMKERSEKRKLFEKIYDATGLRFDQPVSESDIMKIIMS